MDKFYYVTDDQREKGPLELRFLLGMQKRGELPAGTKVRAQDSREWQQIEAASTRQKLNRVIFAVTSLALIGLFSWIIFAFFQPAEPEPVPFEPAKAVDFQEADLQYKQALGLLVKNDYQLARECLDRSIQLVPNRPEYFEARAKAEDGLGDHDEAANDKKQAAALHAKDTSNSVP